MNTPNGRVNLFQPNTLALFNLYDKMPVKQIVTYQNPTEGIFTTTELIDKYFSRDNIIRLQRGIQDGVFKRSNHKYRIGFQDEDTLFIIMRSIYLQYSKNLNSDINGQINSLNTRVLDYCVDQVYNEAQGYMQYLVDASTMYKPMDHPLLVDTEDKTLELKDWF
jgi:hypothetical protein